MSDSPRPKKSWGCLQWAVVIVVVGLLALSLAVPTINITADMARQTSAANNARQITMAMKIDANDNNGLYIDSRYPEFTTSNQVFRKLFQEDIIQDERIFGSPESPFTTDRKIGEGPGFKEAVAPGENHWMWVAGQSHAPSHHPVIFENALDATWPPKWRSDSVEKTVRGRVWKGNKIIVGCNDNSVNVLQLEKAGAYLTLPKSLMEPKDKPAIPALKVLDIETK